MKTKRRLRYLIHVWWTEHIAQLHYFHFCFLLGRIHLGSFRSTNQDLVMAVINLWLGETCVVRTQLFWFFLPGLSYWYSKSLFSYLRIPEIIIPLLLGKKNEIWKCIFVLLKLSTVYLWTTEDTFYLQQPQCSSVTVLIYHLIKGNLYEVVYNRYNHFHIHPCQYRPVLSSSLFS